MTTTLSDGPERPCIVLVEDDAAVRRSLQLLLRGRGLDVRAFASASQALADPHTSAAACLIVDLVMPELDGMALLGALRDVGWTGPAILISGHLTPESSAAAEQAGFNSVLRKPFADASILEEVNRALDGDRPHGANRPM